MLAGRSRRAAQRGSRAGDDRDADGAFDPAAAGAPGSRGARQPDCELAAQTGPADRPRRRSAGFRAGSTSADDALRSSLGVRAGGGRVRPRRDRSASSSGADPRTAGRTAAATERPERRAAYPGGLRRRRNGRGPGAGPHCASIPATSGPTTSVRAAGPGPRSPSCPVSGAAAVAAAAAAVAAAWRRGRWDAGRPAQPGRALQGLAALRQLVAALDLEEAAIRPLRRRRCVRAARPHRDRRRVLDDADPDRRVADGDLAVVIGLLQQRPAARHVHEQPGHQPAAADDRADPAERRRTRSSRPRTGISITRAASRSRASPAPHTTTCSAAAALQGGSTITEQYAKNYYANIGASRTSPRRSRRSS